jgi:cell wall assembly regulator SMI1
MYIPELVFMKNWEKKTSIFHQTQGRHSSSRLTGASLVLSTLDWKPAWKPLRTSLGG